MEFKIRVWSVCVGGTGACAFSVGIAWGREGVVNPVLRLQERTWAVELIVALCCP